MNNNGKVFYVISRDSTDYKGPIDHYLQHTEAILKKSADLESKAALASIEKALKEENQDSEDDLYDDDEQYEDSIQQNEEADDIEMISMQENQN